MPKAFLSHSSKDKERYVEIVAKKLGYHNCVYDELTFEAGMKTFEEIEKNLSSSDLFVLFLSDSALNSSWVKHEMKKAYSLLKNGNLKRIFPIIIDSNIDYRDERIPEWIKDEYNLKYVSRPTVATRRIQQRLREISWESHPRIKEKEKIFVGRNSLIKLFEERIDTFDMPVPSCFIASGIRSIGRRSLLKHCLVKANIVDQTYIPSVIQLNTHESIEDFIYKIYDLGFSSDLDLSNLMIKTIDEKVKIALSIIKDVQNAREIIFIIDNGCIVLPERELSDWFIQILQGLKESDKITFGIASSFRLLKNNLYNINNVFELEVQELTKIERDGLLKRYAKLEELDLSNDDFDFFSNLLKGYPEQVYFTVDLIKDCGIIWVKNNSYQIVEFNSEKVTHLLSKYEEDQKSINFLYLLSQFDFISYNFIFEIVGENDFYKNLLNELFASAICENLGANKEYVRLNDAMRDYLRRNALSIPEEFTSKLNEHLDIFLRDYKEDERDISDFLFSMKEALIAGESIDSKYLIPSHFLKTMKELYDQHNKYEEVIVLADRVLENEEFMDQKIKSEIRYFLCLSLARLRNKRFLQEVRKIKGPDYDFLLGFFYRLTGNNIKAIEHLLFSLKLRPNFSRAKRELVQVYLYIEDYDKALELAKQNYENERNNPYHIQAYFSCIIKADRNSHNEALILELLKNLEKIKTEKAEEMYLRSKAQYLAFYKNQEENSLNLIDETISKFPDVIYPKLVKFDICDRFNRIEDMKEILDQLEDSIKRYQYFSNAITNLKAIYYAKSGNIDDALNLIINIKNYPESAKEKLLEKISKYETSSIEKTIS